MKLYLSPKAILALCTLCLTLFASPTSWAEAPKITLQGLDGKPHPLSEYIGRGKWVIFNIWGPGCPPCAEEMPELQFFHDANHAKTAIVVGAAIDFPSFGYAKPAKVKKFVDNYLINFPILLTDSSITDKIGLGVLAGTPITLVFNRTGKLVTFHAGPVTQKMLEDYIRGYEAKEKAGAMETADSL
jgi:thiol-disulfide isomerase/thioredoxin